MSSKELTLEKLAEIFGGMVAFEESRIRECYGRDMAELPKGGTALLSGEQLAAIQCKSQEERDFWRPILFQFFAGGFSSAELEILNTKARARTDGPNES